LKRRGGSARTVRVEAISAVLLELRGDDEQALDEPDVLHRHRLLLQRRHRGASGV
jgi:hypothetical protein